ncbi:MAG: CHY zinc finger protein [Pseudomonadota bacterium]
MSDLSTYTVISTGKLHEDFGLEDVIESFAKLFKTTPEKASKYVGVQKILKKDMELKKAKALKARLEQIGMVIALKEHQVAASAANELSIEEKAPVKADTTMMCPKCGLRQEKAEQCSSCGVYVQKLLGGNPNDTEVGQSTIIGQTTIIKKPDLSAQEAVQVDSNASVITTGPSINDEVFKIPGIVAATVVALIGALLWKYIAVWFGFEFGIIAWGIGLAIGIAALTFESKGMATGIVCAVLALFSIIGGKYMAMQSFQESWSEDIFSAIEGQEVEFKQYYEQDLKAAAEFGDGVDSKEELIQFLSDHGYEEIYGVEEIGEYELQDFNEYVVPHLKQIQENSPTFEEWLSGSEESIKDLSTFQLMLTDFGILGFVFLGLGVFSAFKMGLDSES